MGYKKEVYSAVVPVLPPNTKYRIWDIPYPVKEKIHIRDRCGFVIDGGWNGSFHDATYSKPKLIAWASGGTKQLRRLNRIFREGKEIVPSMKKDIDPSTERFHRRVYVRSGD